MKKTMKKLFAFGMAGMMAAGLAGCSGSTQETTVAASVTEAQADTQAGESAASQTDGAYAVTAPVEITFATQDVGTTAYVYASTMANLFTDAFPNGSVIDVTTTSPGGVGSPVILENNQCNVTISNGAPAKWACETGILGNPPTENVRGLAGGLDKAILNVIFTQSFVDKTGITTVEELVAQKYPVRIAVKSSGAFGELACNKVLEVLGVSYEDVESWGGSVTQTGSDAIVSLLKDGKADMTIDHIAPGQSATSELCMTADMYFPQLSDDTLEKLTKEGFDYTVIPAGTWSGQDAEIKTVGSPQVILVSAELDDATVYTMTKALCENTQTLVNASAALEAFDPETAWEPIKLGAPIHPGAEAYYKEMGYME
ncbi:TAXI family TRAP transporter solute-binding subunit [Lachnoclostridium pacaense]|uniref:TAXI family TRAP transporter solute-binding subunit n=1 Tax=Enterocloster hominis (ex Hitch et al. 2024) TaxID=1917870 RepID=UPI001D1074F1|nr:TAXI family TRAP transporter solute-binding subunit [Lachnoclostridium pacaense]MCC2817384.1 TAXI family TRAP transporter solute-binding subunit [Lachnoclostridium pacaense]MCD8171082.1 TAXI family TRAP transporter solute-binding subunit [Clostridiales bacterium]